ncbi:MAG: LamG-like jellyroll fold domain-containing protein [Saprospiraceae bacterium]|nr:LamG-like jellyroll fold domain-containing protein [Saprospiraceae bacterium]
MKPVYCLVLIFLITREIPAQTFQTQYGTTMDNAFTKVIPSGSAYYVLGRDQVAAGSPDRATVTRLNANGQHVWTLSLDIGSAWLDAVVTPGGDLLVVGQTLPADPTNQSLAGLVTPNGAFSWVRSYEVPGREAFTRIVRNPAPQNAAFPYYIIGAQNDPNAGATIDDVVLWNIDEQGNSNWKKLFPSAGDDEFVRAMEALPTGDLMLAGNLDADGGVFLFDNTGAHKGGLITFGTRFTFADLFQGSGGNFYAVGNTFPNFNAYLIKYDANLLPVWEANLNGLSAISQVWQAPGGGIYVTGTGPFGGRVRTVVMHFTDGGSSPVLIWTKYLDNGETVYQGGATAFVPPNRMAFADGRIPASGGFGQLCAFMSVSDLDLTTCVTASTTIFVSSNALFYNGPVLPSFEFTDTIPGTDLLSSALNWQQEYICSPCKAGFTFQANGSCGDFNFTNTSTGSSPLTYAWTFGDPTSGANNASAAQDPTHQFSVCGNFKVCLKITDSNCADSICQTVAFFDQVKPTITCPASQVVQASGCPVSVNNIPPNNVSDDCSTPSVGYIITGTSSGFGPNDASGHQFNQGVSTVVYTATDHCGNTASCSFNVDVLCAPGGSSRLCGQSVLTCFSGFNNPNYPTSGLNANGNVVAFVDPRALTNVPPNGMDASNPVNGLPNVPMVKDPQWVYSRMGQVFGLAIDANEFVYATASTIYGKFTDPFNVDVTFGTAGAGGIYKIDPSTGTVTDFVKTNSVNPNTIGTNFIYNTGSGLGNICYDKQYNQFFVTNFTDGKIYRIDINGIVLSTYDHPGSLTFPSNPPGSTFIPLGDRPYGIQKHPLNGRLYYAVWREDLGRQSGTVSNEVWSIALDGAGNFMGAATLVLPIPPMPSVSYSNAPSDLAFSQSGKMLIGERTTSRDWPQFIGSPAHDSRVLEYCCDPVWAPPLTFYVGNLSVSTNCAGGIDYGYAGYDFIQNKPVNCDGLIWSTGDALKFGTGFNPYANDYEVVYGLAGALVSGNSNSPFSANWVKTNSYYIDMGLPGKTEFGDVEVFKCECDGKPDFPCDSLWVTKTQPNPGTCCFNMTFDVHAGPLAYLEAESLTPGVVFNNVTLNNTFAWAGNPTGTLLPIKHNPLQGIPQGTYPNALQFCLANIQNPSQVPQCVVFRWYVKGPDDVPYLACTDTCYFECPVPVPADTCVVVKTDSIACDPANPREYCLFLTVENTSTDPTFIANQLIMSGLTPGFSFKPCPPPVISTTAPSIALNLIPSLTPGNTSNLLCVKLVALSPVITPTVVCMNLGLSGNNDCCHSSIPFCVTLEPCCDPCEDRGIAVQTTDPDSCCHSLDITNDCNYNFFTKLELELITPGVIFGSHFTGGANPGDWNNPISQNNLIQWQHVSGYIPNGTIAGLINFCLDEINNPSEIPQMVVLHWYTTGANGKDSIACSDTLIFDCPQQDFPCIQVLDSKILCKQDASGNVYYEYMLTFQNTSSPPHTADELVFSQIGPPPVVVFPNPISLSPPLLPNGITTITTNLFGTGLSPGDKLTFEVRLHDSTDPDDWCCFEGDTLCIFIPPCDTCVCQPNLTLSQSGVEYPVFCHPHTGFIPVLPCPADDVVVSGFFGCVDPVTGQPCLPSPVVYELVLPDGSIYSGSTNNFPAYILPKADGDDPGLYCLTFTTICPGTFDTCVCKVTWIREACDSCCTDFDAFCNRIENAVTISTDNSLCKATLRVDSLPNCDFIDWVDWGDNQQDGGNLTSGGMAMHQYAGSGTFAICYLAIELDEATGLICFEKIICDTISLLCATPADTCIDPPAGLVAWWSMDDFSGSVVADDIIGSNDGMPMPGGSIGNPGGPEPVPGKVRDALHYTSPGNRHVEVADDPVLNFGSGAFTIDAWIYTNMGTQTEPIVDKLGNTNNGYALSIQGTSPYYLTLVLGTGNTVDVLQGPAITTGEWNFVAVSVNPPTATFFVGNNTNGLTQISNVPITGVPNASNPTRTLRIGYNPFNLHWDIIIDELELFNRALNFQEVQSIFLSDSLGKCPPKSSCICTDLNNDVGAGFTLLAASQENYLFKPSAPLGDCDRVTWDWGDGSPAGTSIGSAPIEHQFLQTGQYDVCMSVLRTEDNGNSCTDVYCRALTDVEFLGKSISCVLRPNPTTGVFTLEFSAGTMPVSASLQIVDMWGRVVQTEALQYGLLQQSFSIAELPPGVYFATVLAGDVWVWRQMVVRQ